MITIERAFEPMLAYSERTLTANGVHIRYMQLLY